MKQPSLDIIEEISFHVKNGYPLEKIIDIYHDYDSETIAKLYNSAKRIQTLGSHLAELRLIKTEFELSLPENVKRFIATGGMCGYWALVYEKLFSKLGYKTRICYIGEKSKQIGLSWLEVETSQGKFCMDRNEIDLYENYVHRQVNSWFMSLGSQPIIEVANKTTFYEDFKKQSIISLNKKFMKSFIKLATDFVDKKTLTFAEDLVHTYGISNFIERQLYGKVTEKELRERFVR